jgi:heterodisulfide reductase subunit C
MTPANEFPGNIIFYLLFVGFLAFFFYSAAVRFRWFTRGQWINRFDRILERLAGLVPWLLGNARVARPRYWYSGILHTFIWWGFIVLQIRTLNFLLNGVDHDISLEKNLGVVYDALRPVMDTFNLLVIVGVAMAAFQRFVWRPRRMTLNLDGWIILGFIFFLMVTDVLVNSLEFYLHPDIDAFKNKELSYLAYGLSEFWDSIGLSHGAAEAMNTVFWYSHLVDFLGFLCYLPYSKHSHVLTIAPQVATRRLDPTGILAPIPNIEEAESFGVGKLEQFTWKQLLDPYTCTECGRCTAACPANLTGKLLSPKHVIVDIRHLMEEQEPAVLPWTKKPEAITPLVDGVGFEQIWDCVTCGACMEECPVFIEHVPTIMDIRRYMVMEQSSMPETAQQTLMQIEQRGHPWRGTQLTSSNCLDELGVVLVFFGDFLCRL